MAGNGSFIIHDGEDVVFSYRHGGVKHPDGRPPPQVTPASPALVRSNTTTTGGQRDGRKQEAEAQDHACCVGGGNLTITFLTNPPLTKTYFPARLDSAVTPPGPPKPAVYNFLTSAAKEKMGMESSGDPEGTGRTQSCWVFSV